MIDFDLSVDVIGKLLSGATDMFSLTADLYFSTTRCEYGSSNA